MILFAIYSVAQARLVQEFIRRTPTEEQIVLFSFHYNPLVTKQLASIAAGLGIEFRDLRDLTKSIIGRSSFRKELLSTRHTTLSREVKLNKWRCKALARERSACRRLIQREGVTCVVVCEDGPGGCGALIAVAKELGVPVVDMPFGIGERREYEMYLEDRVADGTICLVPSNLIGDALRRYAPHWIYPTSHGDATLFDSEIILARVALDIDIPKPWVVHGGNADVLCVESVAMKKIYQREGVDAKKWLMTGSCYADVVYDEIQSDPALLRAYRSCSLVDSSRPRILIALPPSYHSERKAEFDTYAETVRNIICGCRKIHPGALITVSLHPGVPEETVALVQGLVDEISNEWLLRLIPRHDVFVTTFSSTIRWAIFSRKPVMNYDIYSFNYKTYSAIPPVYTTTVLNQMLDRLSNILLSPAAYHEISAEMAVFSDEWGIMDGENSQRIWAEIQRRRSMHIPKPRKVAIGRFGLVSLLKDKMGL